MTMTIRKVFLAIALMNIALFGAWYLALAADAHWGYDGDQGPAYWGALSPDFALCADGSAQSPIDIRDASALELVDIEFNYSDTASTIVNNGHTIQVDLAAGSAIIYNGISYDLLQFHFHAPSEHTIDGEAAAYGNPLRAPRPEFRHAGGSRHFAGGGRGGQRSLCGDLQCNTS